MALKSYKHVDQGSEDWLRLRCGILTASEVKLILTEKTRKRANNDHARAHAYELLSQRITGHVEPRYVTDDMLRGHQDEIEAKALYSQHYAPVQDVGFYTEDKWGFVIGYSPDGVVGDDGLIECKSRRPKYQMQVILSDEVPAEHMAQLQTALLVTGRQWIDYISYCGGLPMWVKRVHPDAEYQAAILHAAAEFEAELREMQGRYSGALDRMAKVIETERRIEQEMYN